MRGFFYYSGVSTISVLIKECITVITSYNYHVNIHAEHYIVGIKTVSFLHQLL